MDYKKQAIERFSEDLYATKTTGIRIEEVYVNYAKCSLAISENHLNAAGYVMGGAIFTLVDFAFAVVANCDNELTVSLSSHISYINATKGPVLFAEAKCVKNARNISFFDIAVSDGNGTLVANVSTSGYRKGETSLLVGEKVI